MLHLYSNTALPELQGRPADSSLQPWALAAGLPLKAGGLDWRCQVERCGQVSWNLKADRRQPYFARPVARHSLFRKEYGPKAPRYSPTEDARTGRRRICAV